MVKYRFQTEAQALRKLAVAVRGRAEQCPDLTLSLRLECTDRNLTVLLTLRRGVLELGTAKSDTTTDVGLRMSWAHWVQQMALGWPELDELIARDEARITAGSHDALIRFLRAFESPAERMQALVVR